jgi:hypothetical protein
MSSFRIGVVVCLFGLAAAAAHAQSSAAAAESASAAPPVENGIPIARLVSQVGHETHKKFVIDPHIRADIALGDLNPSELSRSTAISQHSPVSTNSSWWTRTPTCDASSR